MALLNCSECNKEISDQARTCPHCGVKKRSRIRDVLLGVVAAIVAVGILAECVSGSEEKDASKQSEPANSAKAHLPATSKTIGRSTDDVMGKLAAIERSSSVPLRDGSPRESIRIGKYVRLEAIGEPSNLTQYSLMFGLASDDKVGAIETALFVATVLGNTFPTWGVKPGDDTPEHWVTKATSQLGVNIERNKDDPEPVILERDGLRIEYSVTPALGLFFLTVKPQAR